MIAALAEWLERYLPLGYEQVTRHLNRLIVTLAAMGFILISTLIVSFDTVFSQNSVSSLQVGDVASENILAPERIEYVSDLLTEQRRQDAGAGVRSIYDPPDPSIARQQSDLTTQILDYITHVRQDAFATPEQQLQDLSYIADLELSDTINTYILEIDSGRWQDVRSEIITVLERMMRSEIQENNLNRIRSQIPNQVGIRFNNREAAVIVAIVSDLIRANTVLNTESTAAERERAMAAVSDVVRSFQIGEIVVQAGTRITDVDYETLDRLGLLRPSESRQQAVAQGLLGSIIVMVVVGLYVARFRPSLLYNEPRFLTLLATVFLIVLMGARFSLTGQFYIYPTAAMALLFVAIIGPEIAIISTLGLALLVGLMAGSEGLEFTTFVAAGGLIGALVLRRSERLNSFFFAGLIVALSNVAVLSTFNMSIVSNGEAAELVELIGYCVVNGILTAAAAMAAMYIVTLVFNLPTALKLVELSQPNQPLMQRLIREAPGSYQHSLQVANLAEQAANAIGANAELTRVAALYHDIGKIRNPAFFIENQGTIGNPHDILNDPYRSADIIISHVTEGDEMARQYRLPNRFRDFIREHHGTSQVYVFYKQALILAGEDQTMVNSSDFAYPGPRPQSRETSVLMLADSCEAAVRSRQPKTKQEIVETVRMVLNGKRDDHQLDDSGLTLSDLAKIEAMFIDMLQAMFHPRINYAQAVEKVRRGGDEAPPRPVEPVEKPAKPVERPLPKDVDPADLEDEDTPLAEVPRLRRTSESRSANGMPPVLDEEQPKEEQQTAE